MKRITLIGVCLVMLSCPPAMAFNAGAADAPADCLDIVAGILSAPCDLLGACVGMFSPQQPQYKVVCEKVRVPIKEEPRKQVIIEAEPGEPVPVSAPEPEPKEEPADVTVIIEPPVEPPAPKPEPKTEIKEEPKPVESKPIEPKIEKPPAPEIEKPKRPKPKKPKKEEPTIYYYKAPCGPPPPVPGYFNPLYTPR